MSIRDKVVAAMDGAVSPAVLYSGGADSTLLLALAREVRNDVTAIHFRTGIPVSLNAIRDWGLTGLSWLPADTYLLSDGNSRVRVQEYDFDGMRLPVITDLTKGTACSRLPTPTVPFVATGFDVLLWGARDSDTHWLKGGMPFPPDGFILGKARLYALLREMSDAEVAEAVERMGLHIEPQPDELPLCTACFGDGEVWCPLAQTTITGTAVDWAAGLAAFRQRMEVQHG